MSLLVWFGKTGYSVDWELADWPLILIVYTLVSAVATAGLITSYLNEYVHVNKI